MMSPVRRNMHMPSTIHQILRYCKTRSASAENRAMWYRRLAQPCNLRQRGRICRRFISLTFGLRPRVIEPTDIPILPAKASRVLGQCMQNELNLLPKLARCSRSTVCTGQTGISRTDFREGSESRHNPSMCCSLLSRCVYFSCAAEERQGCPCITAQLYHVHMAPPFR
jgi:hypothetical protein